MGFCHKTAISKTPSYSSEMEMSFTSNVCLSAVSIFRPRRSLGVIALSASGTFDKYKSLDSIRFGREQEGMVCWLQSTRSYKVTLYNLFRDLQTACVNMLNRSKGVAACFYLLGLVSAPLFIHCWQKRTVVHPNIIK